MPTTGVLEMKVTKQYLIELCDKFLCNKIDKSVLKDFAWEVIGNDDFEWEEDDIVSDTIFDWDNEEMNFEISKTNIQLWKKRLITGQDELISYNSWNSHIINQKEICKANNSIWKPINNKLKIAVSSNLNKDPINGLRFPAEKGTTGWFIWTGEYDEGSFITITAKDLLKQRPEIIKFLGLDVGFKFLADNKEYKKIWYDTSLKKTVQSKKN